MVLKKKTISLILIFFGVLTIIFGAFFGYVASSRKRELVEQIDKLNNSVNELRLKVDSLDYFYKTYYKLVDPYFDNQHNTPEYIKSIISCMAVRANFTLDRAFYKSTKMTLKLRNKKLYNKYRLYELINSCYFSFAGLEFPLPYTKIINRGGKFDITVEETDKRPTLLKLVSVYMDKIQELVTNIDKLDIDIAESQRKLNKFLVFETSNFTEITKTLRDKENEIISKIIKETDKAKAQKNLSDIEGELTKDDSDNNLIKKYYIVKRKFNDFSEDFTELLNKFDHYLLGIVEQVYKKEFSSDEILREKDYKALCTQTPVDIPPLCRDIICSGKKDGKPYKIKSFLWIVTELERPKLVKINELKYTMDLKSRLDRNDSSILDEFKNSQETLPNLAMNIMLLRQTKKTLEGQIEKIKSKIAKQKIEKKSVGKILSIDTRANKGVINLGRRNGLFNNTVFEVYGVIKGRDFVFKGMAKVLKLGEENSRILILPVVSVEDKSFIISKGAGVAYPEFFDIITKEYIKRLPYRNIIKISSIKDLRTEIHDLLYSEIFDPSQKKVISFAGNLHLIYTNAEAVKKFVDWNFKVQDKADINNEYVVLGKDYQDSENYRIAKELNIKLLREKDLYDFLELQYRY